MPTPTRRSLTGLALVAAGVVVITLWATARYGPGASPDGASYVAAARSLLEGRGFMTFGPTRFTAWPPLLPIEVASLGLLGVDPLDGLAWINALASGLTVWLGGRCALEGLASRTLAWLAIAALVALPASRLIGLFAWSEPTFTVFLLLTVRALARLSSSPGPRVVVLAGLCAAAACSTRFVGIAAVIAGVWAILAARTRPRRVRDAAVFAGVALVPVVAWVTWNVLVDPHPLGDRYAGASDFVVVATGLGCALHEGLLGVDPPPSIVAVTWGVLALVTIVTAAVRSRADAIGEGLRSSAVYILLLSGLAMTVGFDGWNRRFFAPIAPFLVLGLVRAVDAWGPRLAIVRRVGPWVLAAGVAVMATASVSILARAREGRLPYQARGRADLAVVQWLREHELPGLVFTNDPASLSLFARCDGYVLPSLVDARGNGQARVAVDAAPPDTARWLVWIGPPDSVALAIERSKLERSEPVAELADGAVFRIR